ncbi:MAG TPA: hypothetical protein VGH29_15905 [Candidatus Binataceae bacterium]
MDQNVRAGKEIVQRAAVGRVLQIQRNAPLTGVEIKEQAAFIRIGNVMGERAAPAGYITLRRLDFNYGRAKGSQQSCGESGRNSLTAFDDGDIVQWQWCGSAGIFQ